jgi:hypothetical protein
MQADLSQAATGLTAGYNPVSFQIHFQAILPSLSSAAHRFQSMFCASNSYVHVTRQLMFLDHVTAEGHAIVG